MRITDKSKMLQIVKQKAKNYKKLLKHYKKESNFLLGDHQNRALGVPDDFDFSTLSGDFFMQKNPQGFAMPLTNETFKRLRNLPKRAINSHFIVNNRGKNIYGQYMVGIINKKPILFAFSIVIDEKDSNKFSVKLDACIRGLDWINISRFDSEGEPHPNYITLDGKIVIKAEDIEMCQTPHLHINSQEAQVIFGDSLDYSTAVHIPREKICESSDQNQFLIKSIELFMDSVNIKETLNQRVFDGGKTYMLDLFEPTDQKFLSKASDIKEW